MSKYNEIYYFPRKFDSVKLWGDVTEEQWNDERKGVFLPKLIIIDEKGNHVETTNRTKLPLFDKMKKSELLGYSLFDKDMPLTNPADISDELEIKFKKSKYVNDTIKHL